MSRYDWGFVDDYEWRWGGARGGPGPRPDPGRRYGQELRAYGGTWFGPQRGPQYGPQRRYGGDYGGGGYAGGPGAGTGFMGGGRVGGGREGYGGVYADGGGRGVYGEAYPGFHGYPGGPRGEYYGGGGFGPGRASQGRGYDAGWGGGQGTFIPEEAYRRHPELARQPPRRQWEEYQSSFGEELSDDEILEGVQQRIYDDPWLDVKRIDVAVEDGVVTLTGEVDDFLEARYAWDDAWETDGVRGVVNNLTVRTDLPHPAREIHGDAVPQSAGAQQTADAAAAAEG